MFLFTSPVLYVALRLNRYTYSPCTVRLSILRQHTQARSEVGKLVVVCRWSAVYSTEPQRTVCTGFPLPFQLPVVI